MTPPENPAIYSGPDAWAAKFPEYFAHARRDFVAELPRNPQAKILEIGCGEGGTGALALSQGKCGFYCGVDIWPAAAEKAKAKLSEVVVGDIEKLEPPWAPETFDALVVSEVLEHLVDPWATLRKLHPVLKPGARVFASSPNASYYKMIYMLLRGEWTWTESGHMDRTHLRWFTPKTYLELFESCGYCVDSVREVAPLRKRARVISALTFGRLRHLFVYQIDLRAHRL